MMAKMQLKRTFFIAMSLLFLTVGLIGISRLHLRPGAQFQWENRKNHVVVTNVFPGGVADEGGLVDGDIVLGLEDTPIRRGQEIDFLLDGQKPGQTISLTAQRNGERVTLSLVLVSRYGKEFIIINLLLGLLFWAVGVFVSLKKPAERAARVFSWGSMTLAAAILMVWPHYPHGTNTAVYFLPTLYFVLYPLAPAFILYFTALYPREKLILHRHAFLRSVVFGPSLCFVILLEGSYLPAVYLNSLEFYRSFSILYNGFRAYFILYLIMAIGCLIHSYRFSHTKEDRNKVQWILWGISFGAAPFLFLWTFPHILGFSSLIPEEMIYVFVMMIPLAVAFSIVKYQAMDIDIVINRSIVYVLVTGVIVTLYLTLVGLAGYVLQTVSATTSSVLAIICTLIAAALFSPIRRRIQTLVDKTFYRVKYTYQLAIKDFSKALTSARDETEVTDLLLAKIDAAIPVEKIALMLRDSSKEAFEVRGAVGMDEQEKGDLRFELDADVAHVAERRRVPLLKKARARLRNIAELPRDTVPDRIGIELLIPTTLQGQLVGFLALGRKLSGARFSEEDLELLVPMAEEGFMALERLKLQETMILERAQKEKLEEVSGLKSEFISHVSHEFRTPLTSIRWSVENLLDGIPEKPSLRVREYLAGIYDSTSHLGRMIENLLDITRIEAGRIEIHPERVSLSEEIRKAVDMSNPLAEKKHVRLEIVAAENVRAKADRDCLQAILTNLLDNAVKYSHESDVVRVEVTIADEEESKKAGRDVKRMAAISVVDHGAGIPKEKQRVIFERFERIRKENAAREKGLGLGLHIVKKLVELQGGCVWVESEVEKGSTFAFTLPTEESD